MVHHADVIPKGCNLIFLSKRYPSTLFNRCPNKIASSTIILKYFQS